MDLLEKRPEKDADLGVVVPDKGKRGYTEKELEGFEKDLQVLKGKIAAARRDISERKRKEATRHKIQLGGLVMKFLGYDLTFSQHEALVKYLFKDIDKQQRDFLLSVQR